MHDFGLDDVSSAIQWHPECEFIRKLGQDFLHFIAIFTIVGENWKESNDTYLSLPTAYKYSLPNLRKQETLYTIGKSATRCLMIGNRLCHSFLILLMSNPDLTIDCLDIDNPVVEYLNRQFNNRIRRYTGGDGYDLVHIDVDIPKASNALETYIPCAERGKYVMINEHKHHHNAIQSYIERGNLVWVSSCESAMVTVRNLHK